jgi:hypothetical protein
MELRLLTAIGLLLVITVGAVVGVTIISLVLPGGSGGAAPAPDSGADAEAPSVDAPDTGLVTRVFRYAVAFGLGGFVGLFLGIFVGQKAARSQSTEPIPDQFDDYGDTYGDGTEPYAEPEAATGDSQATTEGEAQAAFGDGHADDLDATADSKDRPWESNR